MDIILNNRPETIARDKMSIAEIIIYKNFTFKLLVTKINNILVKKEDRNSTIVENGDNVTILHLISGG